MNINAKKGITTLLMAMVLFGQISLKESNRLNLELSLSNIEALAYDENGENVICFGVGTVDCPKNHSKVVIVYKF